MNIGDNNPFFRERFGGFNKDDVAEYIAKLSKDYSANEEKYKEHIAKLNAELKAKNDGTGNGEISRMAEELKQKDIKISAMQVQLDLGGIDTEELIEQKDMIDSLTEELEELREKHEALETEAAGLRGGEPKPDSVLNSEAEALNQLAFQLAESESERLFLFNLLKKFVSALNIESARDKDIEHASDISDIAPKSEIALEIENGLGILAGFKEKAAELESENAGLKEDLAANRTAQSDEQKMYETVTADLGGIIYSAKKSAEEILIKAKTEAENIISEAKLEAEYILEDAGEKKNTILEETRRNMAEMRGKYELIKQEHGNMVQKYKEISENYAARLGEIEDTIKSIYDSVNNAAE